MLSRYPGRAFGIGPNFRHAGQLRHLGDYPLIGSHQNGWDLSRDNGACHFDRFDAGDDARAAPQFHFGERLLEIAGGNVETPRAMQAGIPNDATEHATAIATRGLNQERDLGTRLDVDLRRFLLAFSIGHRKFHAQWTRAGVNSISLWQFCERVKWQYCVFQPEGSDAPLGTELHVQLTKSSVVNYLYSQAFRGG